MFNLNKTWFVAIERKTGQVVDASQPNERHVQFVRKDFTERFKSPRYALTVVSTPTLENFFDDRTCQEIYKIAKAEEESARARLDEDEREFWKSIGEKEPSLKGFCGKIITFGFGEKRKRKRK